MGLIANYLEGRAARREVNSMAREMLRADASLEMMHERLAELELATEDEGWQRLGREGERDFSETGRRVIVKLARLMWLKNPLIRRAVNVQTYYVMGQGVEISGHSVAVNDVLGEWMDDPGNQAVLTAHQGMTQRETDLQVNGELFFVNFHTPDTGAVRTRTIHPDEIAAVITNPEDDEEPWYYLRVWSASLATALTTGGTEQRKELYPALNYRPKAKPASVEGVKVNWDSPVYHVKVGVLGGMRRGLPDFYAGMAYARTYDTFLEDWASISRSLSRWAWKYSTGKNQSVSRVKARFGSTAGDDGGSGAETNPPASTGSMAVLPSSGDLTPIPKTGAQVSSEDGRQLRTMVAAATDIPDTILAGDPDMGNLATAKTLDRPTELAMSDRQKLWASVFETLTTYVIERAVVAPGGALKGNVTTVDSRIVIDLRMTDPDTGEVMDAGIDVSFPPILDQDTRERVGAIVSAATLDGKVLANTMTPEEVSRQLMSALGVANIDDALTELFPPEAAAGVESVAKVFRAELREYLTAGRNGQA